MTRQLAIHDLAARLALALYRPGPSQKRTTEILRAALADILPEDVAELHGRAVAAEQANQSIHDRAAKEIADARRERDEARGQGVAAHQYYTRAAAALPPVRAKRLRWIVNDEGSRAHAEYRPGQFLKAEKTSGGWALFETIYAIGGDLGVFDTLDDAQAHGQALFAMKTVADVEPAPADSTAATLRHIARVRALLGEFAVEMIRRGERHDASKFDPVEKGPLDEMQGLIEREGQAAYGTPEYKRRTALLGPMIAHHHAHNAHHPEHYSDGVAGMDLHDLVEMFFDWKAASERGEEQAMSLTAACERYGVSTQLASILHNTAYRLGFAFN